MDKPAQDNHSGESDLDKEPKATLVMRSIIDNQLETTDHKRIGRVGDIEAAWGEDGQLVLTHLLTGPQVLAGRLHPGLRKLARFFLRDRFEQRLEISEVEKIGPTIRLRRNSAEYPIGRSEKWITDHIIGWIPGSGRKSQ